MNYAQFITALKNATNTDNAAFTQYIPTIIDQAEGKIYREPEFDFLSSVVTDGTGFTTADNQQFILPRHFTILQDVNLISGNDRPPLTKISREALNALFPRRVSNAPSDVPSKWAPLTDSIILLAPTPGSTIGIECVGTARPANLSADNTTPWLWTYLGDLAFAAAMIYASAWQRNFGAQADDPKMAVSWDQTYDKIKAGVAVEEMRRKLQATGGGA